MLLGQSALSMAFDNDQRVNLFPYGPTAGSAISKYAIDQFHRAVGRRQPSAFKDTGIMKEGHAARRHKRAPVPPVALHPSLGMIAVNQQEIDPLFPVAHRILAELLDPHGLTAAHPVDRPM